MKKVLLSIALLLLLSKAQAQFPVYQTLGGKTSNVHIPGAFIMDTVGVIPSYADTASASLATTSKYISAAIVRIGNYLWMRSGNVWVKQGNTPSIFPGGPITTLPIVGNNPGTNITPDQFITSQFYGTQPPTASLTGGGTFEYTNASTQSATLNWSAGRSTATNPLASIVVAGITQTFSQPAQGASVSGTQAVTVPTNTNTTYTNTVTTTDGKTASATTTFSYQNKIYAGFVPSATPTDAEIIAATGSGYVSGFFSGSRNQSGSLSTPSATKYYVFVSPASYGTPNIIINGLGVTFNQTTRTFVNASGYSSSYIVAVSPFPTAGQIDSYLVN